MNFFVTLYIWTVVRQIRRETVIRAAATNGWKCCPTCAQMNDEANAICWQCGAALGVPESFDPNNGDCPHCDPARFCTRKECNTDGVSTADRQPFSNKPLMKD
jgi:hypothetical protein